ncbi:MAG TPA: chorismate mutase [Jiangellaceae bacterium]
MSAHTNEPAVRSAVPSTESVPASRPTQDGHARIGGQLLGAGNVAVLAGPRRGADIVHISLRRHHGTVEAAAELAKVRDLDAGPLLVEPFSAADLDAAAEYADGLVVGGAWMQDFRLLYAVGELGLPVVLHRGAHNTVGEWLAAVEYVRAGSAAPVVLAEGGHRTRGDDRPVLDLALLREVHEKSGLPVLADVSASPWLASAAVAAGSAGLWLDEESSGSDVDAARDVVAMLIPAMEALEGSGAGRGDGRPSGQQGGDAAPAALAECRAAIDRVDAALATLLEHRVRLAGEVQKHKPVGGHAGRDRSREAQIVHAMGHRAPSLDRDALARIMDVVITAGLDAAEKNRPRIWQM